MREKSVPRGGGHRASEFESAPARYVWVSLLAVAFLVLDVAIGLGIHDWNFMDENTYGSAAVNNLYVQGCRIYFVNWPTYCNYEHPPLVKVLESVSLYLFGWTIPKGQVLEAPYFGTLMDLSSSPLWFFSFRFFQLVMGALSLLLIYLIAYRLSGNRWLALTASCLMFLEPLYAFFSRTDYLEIPMIFFGLLAYAVYFSRVRFGALNEFWLSGFMLGLCVISKESGVAFIIPLVTYHVLFTGTGRVVLARLKGVAEIVLGSGVVAALGLQIFDSLERTPFPLFTDQVAYIFAYAKAIACGNSCYLSPGPTSWFEFFVPTRWSEGLSGNQVLLWLVAIWVPVGAMAIWRSRGRAGPNERIFVFASLLFASTFLENVLIYLDGRQTWIYYYLSIVPALSLGGGYLLVHRSIPSWTKVAVWALLIVGYVWAYVAGPSLLKYS